MNVDKILGSPDTTPVADRSLSSPSGDASVANLAAQMGVTVADLSGFIAALRVWMAKGYTMEQAIEKHMAQMGRIVNLWDKIDARTVCVDAFFPEAA